MFFKKLQKNNSGQSLIELILAVAIFGLIASGIASLSLGGFSGLQIGERHFQAQLLAQEGIEAVRAVRDRAWNEARFSQSGVEVSGSEWRLSGEGTSEVVGDFTRVITFSDVCRTTAKEIVACPGDYTDPHTKEVTASVIWQTLFGTTNEVRETAYLSNWDSRDWIQTDWFGGDGQSIWSDPTRYNSDNNAVDVSNVGQVRLVEQAGGGTNHHWPFTTPSNYIYDTNKIEVSGGTAHLIGDTQGSTGSTTNLGFDSGSTGWTFQAWDVGGGEVTPTGAWQSSGGDPGGLVDINIPSDARNDTVGGFWSQPINISISNPDSVSCEFDWRIIDWNIPVQGVDNFRVAVYLDNFSGAPTLGQEIFSSTGTPTGPTAWSGIQSLDCTNKVNASGTYYYKIAVWLDAVNLSTGPIRITYDNTQVEWSDSSTTYPSDRPTIEPNYDAEGTNVGRWTALIETATKNGGQIYYQLSKDSGTSWQYWNGTAWVNADLTQYNTASVINSNITTYPSDTGKIRFRAFLESDGSQEVILDNVEITWIEARVWPYTTASNYVYDSNKIEVVGGSAHLVGANQGSYTDTSNNPTFDTDFSSWTFKTWGPNIGQSGGRVVIGGNPDGYAEIVMPSDTNKMAGAYIEQLVEITRPNVSSATLDFDWKITGYSGPADSLRLYAFVDQTPAAPTIGNEWWNSGIQTGTTEWQGVATINLSSLIDGPGIYRVKVGVWVDYADSPPPRNYSVGLDNVILTWSGTVAGGFSTDNPSIHQTQSHDEPTLTAFTGFDEETIKDGGEIYYQLCNDEIVICETDGWYYWNGSSWAIAGAGQYSTASVVNANISSFPIGNKKIAVKAFLSSSGNQWVHLDSVTVKFTRAGGTGGFATLGILTSSAFNTTFSDSKLQVIEWDENVPTNCTPVPCEIKLQLRAAEDSAGTPGAWTDWFGPGGAGTFFTNHFGELIPLTLNDYQWAQYRAELRGDGAQTPTLFEVRVNYQ